MKTPFPIRSLCSFIANGQTELARDTVQNLLRLGAVEDLGELSLKADIWIMPGAGQVVDKLVADEAHISRSHGEARQLFALPIFVDESTDRFSVEEISSVIRDSYLGEGSIDLVELPVHAADLMDLDCIEYSGVVNAVANPAGHSANGMAALPDNAFPKTWLMIAAARRGVASDTVSYSVSTDEGDKTIGLYFVLGTLPAADLSADTGFDTGITMAFDHQKLSQGLEEACNGFWGATEPGRPLEVVSDAVITVGELILEARYRDAPEEHGMPVSHVHFDGDMANVVLTTDGANVIDSFELRADKQDREWLMDVVEENSFGVDYCERAEDMPKLPEQEDAPDLTNVVFFGR